MLDQSYFDAIEQVDWKAAGKVYAFGYYGGKLSHLSRLLPLLPRAHTYVEPFGGSAAVLLNREPSPVEVYNDLDGEVVNFFRVLRKQPDELIRQISLTPYSRYEFALACERRTDVSNVERARRFYVRINQSRGNMPNAIPSDWQYCVGQSRRGMSGAVSAWHGNIDGLDQVVGRLLRVQIENVSAADLIQRYDTPVTLFYVDPPYVLDARDKASTEAYVHEMTDEQHIALASTLKACKGKVALSGYAHPLYEELYEDWFVSQWGSRAANAGNGKAGTRTEVLWTNYDPTATDELPLFAFGKGAA